MALLRGTVAATLLCGVALVMFASCGKSDSKPQMSAAPPAVHVSQLAIFVDDAAVATLQIKDLAAWPRLDTVVPTSARRLGTWASVRLIGQGATDVPAPSSTFRDLVPAVFPGIDGDPAFGMFDPVELAKRGKPSLRQDHLREIRIALSKDTGRGEHEQGEGGGHDPLQIRLTVKTKAGTSTVDGAALLALPRDNVPGTTDPKGWTLQKILDAAGVKAFDKLILLDARGTALNVDKTAFDSKTSIPFVKLNRQGLLRLRIFKKQGANWNPTGGDLREFTAVEVVK